MTHPPYIREKALEMRRRGMTLDEIAERLALSKTTVFYWIKDLPIPPRPRPATPRQRKGNEAMVRKYAALRDAAYEEGRGEFDSLPVQATFIDFVCMYIGEGYKRSRNTLSLANSDALVIQLAARWIKRLTRNAVSYHLQYHADQAPDELRRYWSGVLRVDAEAVRLQRKSNSGQLNGRNWRSEHGVLTVCTNDTLLRARLAAWMDRVKASWLDSMSGGV